MVLKMPEQLTGEKIPGHEALRRAARAITEAPLEGMTDEQKKELQTELQIQVRARRGDFIPEEVRFGIISEVVRAGAMLSPDLDEYVGLVLSNLRHEALKRLLEELGQPYVIYITYNTHSGEMCPGIHVATRQWFDELEHLEFASWQLTDGHPPMTWHWVIWSTLSAEALGEGPSEETGKPSESEETAAAGGSQPEEGSEGSEGSSTE